MICKLTLIVPKQLLQSEIQCSSQTGRSHCAYLIRFFVFLSTAEAASLPRRQLPSLKGARKSKLKRTWSPFRDSSDPREASLVVGRSLGKSEGARWESHFPRPHPSYDGRTFLCGIRLVWSFHRILTVLRFLHKVFWIIIDIFVREIWVDIVVHDPPRSALGVRVDVANYMSS